MIAELVTLIGEGEYNLDALKEIKVTDSYLGLDQDVRGCQNEESLNNCKTKHYLKTLLEKCDCLPFNIRLSEKVSNIMWPISLITMLQDPICTSADKFQCMKSIKNNRSECLHPCSGLLISSFTKSGEGKDLESLISRDVAAYRNFTKWSRFPSGIKGENKLFNVMI